MTGFKPVAPLADLPSGSMLVVELDGQQICLFNCAGHMYATDHICSHAYAELSEGELDEDDCTIECPLHGARFDLATGRALSLPATQAIEVYSVRVHDAMIEIAI